MLIISQPWSTSLRTLSSYSLSVFFHSHCVATDSPSLSDEEPLNTGGNSCVCVCVNNNVYNELECNKSFCAIVLDYSADSSYNYIYNKTPSL